jgi:hypothetical protein
MTPVCACNRTALVIRGTNAIVRENACPQMKQLDESSDDTFGISRAAKLS